MDVVIRSSQGEAEVTIAPLDLDATLGEVIEDVTDRPAPRVVHVDGHAVPSDTSLGSSGVLIGSVLDVGNEPTAPPRDAVVELVQLAGHGSGRRLWLTPGRYRVGPGRRVHGVELAAAAVEDARLELIVDAHGAVQVRSDAPDARLEGSPFDGPSAEEGRAAGEDRVAGERFRSWDEGRLRVGGRVFALDRHDPRDERGGRRRRPAVDVDGSVAFNRPPRVPPAAEPTPPEMATDGQEVAEARSSTQRWARGRHPTIPEVARIALETSPALWQRRPSDLDAYRIPIGLADRPWDPARGPGSNAPDTATRTIADAGELYSVPVVADLTSERGIGIVASEDTGTEMARGVMLAAAAVHGPADLDIVVLTSADRLDAWEWAKWLPHIRGSGGPAVLSDAEQITPWAEGIRANHVRPARPTPPDHITLVVVDEPTWWRERSAPLRSLFGDATLPLRFVALAPAVVDLPAVCTTVISEHDERLAVEYVLQRERIDDVAGNLVDAELATQVARALAPLDDPDLPPTAESDLPAVVPIIDLLGFGEISARAILERWSASERPPAVRVPVGVAERGAVTIDLVADGPHGLIAGMAGSGRNELLLNLIAGLAAGLPPDDINFVLVDFEGSSAFGACAALPHTVAMASHLDEHLAERLLRCLRAELRHREVMLEEAGNSSIEEYHRLSDVPPLPRLVIVVDEFASAAVELPEFVPSLVDVAQRGRNLGIHMIFATQHPAGVVDNQIKANTNLRIALRVQDEADSMEVIGTRDAAALSRRVPGRAFARFAAGELVEFQSASSTGATEHLGGHRFGVRPFVLGRALTPQERRLERHFRPATTPSVSDGDDREDGRESDLVRLVRATSEAARHLGQDHPRRPCPDPLPEQLPLGEFFRQHPGDAVPFALVDLPDEQRQVPAWWQPGADGNLAVYGDSGAGTSSLLAAIALGAAQRQAPDDLHLYAIDADSSRLAPLAELPHCGAVVGSDEADRIARLVRFLGEEVDRRASLAPGVGGASAVARDEPGILLLVDDVGALHQRLAGQPEMDGVWSELERVIREGRPVGLCAVMAAKHERAISAAITNEIDERLVLRLGDQFAYAAFGLRPADLPNFVPGRAVRIADRTELQLVEPPTDLVDAVAEIDEPALERPPRQVHALPASVSVDSIVGAARATDRGFAAPVGLSMATSSPIHLEINFGETTFVAGRPKSGKSSVLVAVAEAARQVDDATTIFAVGPRGGPLAASEAIDDRPAAPADVAAWVDRIEATPGRKVVLVDDADRVGGPSFERLGSLRGDDCALVVAGLADDLRTTTHWSRPLQNFGTGVLIDPTPQDAELLQASLGPRQPRSTPGTGVVVNHGEMDQALLVRVDADDEAPDSDGRTIDVPVEREVR